MGILDNAKYAEIGKRAEARSVADGAIQQALPQIEKEAVRKFAPAIQEEATNAVLSQLEGLAAYGSGDGVVVPEGVNVTNEEMQQAQSMFGSGANMQDILDMRKLNSLSAVNNGSTGAAPDGGLANILNTK